MKRRNVWLPLHMADGFRYNFIHSMLICCRMGRRRARNDVIDPPLVLLPLQIWSMGSDAPVHSFKVDSYCESLAWRPKAKTEDVDGGIAAARKSKENLTIAW